MPQHPVRPLSLETTSTLAERIWQDVATQHADYLARTADLHTTFLASATSLIAQSQTTPSIASEAPQIASDRPQMPQNAPTLPETTQNNTPPPAPVNIEKFVTPDPTPPAAIPSTRNTEISTDVVRQLISEKTGYPTDMLQDDMDLEGELGVDSIKQVEILSTLRERHPELPDIDPEALAELRTIRGIADFFA